MSSRAPDGGQQAVYVRAPDHLGDGVLAIPAVAALQRLGPVVVRGPGWVRLLYRGLATPVDEVPRGTQLGVLFKPAFRAVWESRRRTKTLVGTRTDGRGWLLDEAVEPEGHGAFAGEHRLDAYARVALAAGASAGALGSPTLAPTAQETAAAMGWVGPSDVLLLPGSASGAVVQWSRYRALADALGEHAVFAGGPLEEAWLPELAGPHRHLPTLPLGELAAVAAQASGVVANDSGLAHLATAARRGSGREPGDVVVIYGSTVPERTGPPGSTSVLGPRVHCAPCYRKRCAYSLECLDLDVAPVLAALARRGVSQGEPSGGETMAP